MREMSEATKAKYNKAMPVRGVLARFPRAILEIAKVSAVGTQKHRVPLDDTSYKTLDDAEWMYVEAEVRHLLAEHIDGQVSDDSTPEITLYHKAQKAWDALADLEVFLENMKSSPSLNSVPGDYGGASM